MRVPKFGKPCKLSSNHSFFVGYEFRGPKFGRHFKLGGKHRQIRVEGSEIRKTIQCKLVMTVVALISAKGIRNLERLFVNTNLCSCIIIVRLAQWKNKMVIFDGIVFF